MSRRSDQRNRRVRVGDIYRLAFAGVAWAIYLVLILFSSSFLSHYRPAAYGMGCLLAAYTVFALVIWRKNSR